MMNNRGQVFVVFVILIPIILFIIGFIFDKCYLMYQENELKNIGSIVCSYSFGEEIDDTDISDLAIENDKDIYKVIVDRNSSTTVTLKKEVKSVFGTVIGIPSYQITSSTSCIE